MKNLMTIAAVGAFALGVGTIEAQAGATAQPGETVGLAVGAPLPEGVYFVNTLDWGVRNVQGNEDPASLVNIPVIAWSTPWRPLGLNFQIIGAAPAIHADGSNLDDEENYGFYNPILAARVAYDLGGGLGVSYLSGFYFNAGDKDIRVRATTWRQDFAASYTDNGWNLTANLIWGITFDTSNCALCAESTSNGFNLDLTATKTFGKWEVGLVGFGSTEYDLPDARRRSNGGFGKSEQFALGGLIGYNAGGAILQAYLTHDVYAKNTATRIDGGGNLRRDNAKETRIWGRVIIPFVTEASTPLVTKY